jgi:hypothetical protein
MASRLLVEAGSSAGEARDLVLRKLEELGHLESRVMTEIRHAVEHGEPAAMHRAEDELREALHGNPALGVVLDILSFLSLANLAAEGRPSTAHPLEGDLRAAAAAAQATRGAVNLFDAAGRLVDRPGGAVRQAAAELKAIVEMLEKPISVLTAVSGIIDGMHTVSSALEVNDRAAVMRGNLQIASGVYAMLGVIMAVPGLEPASIALGLVAAIIGISEEQDRTPTLQVFESLIVGVTEMRSVWNGARLLDSFRHEERPAVERMIARAPDPDRRPLHERTNLAQFVSDVVRAKGQWTWWHVRRPLPLPMRYGAHQAIVSAQRDWDQTVHHDLVAAGIAPRDATRMIEEPR